MNLRRKKLNMYLLVMWLAVAWLMMPVRAYAVEDDPPEGEKSFWDKIQEAGSNAADYVGEHKDGWIESAKDGASAIKDKAGELYDSAKEAAPGLIDKAKDGISNAQQQFSDWNAGQQQEFWDRFEEQTGVGVGGDSSASTPAPKAPVESVPPVAEQTKPAPPSSVLPAGAPNTDIDRSTEIDADSDLSTEVADDDASLSTGELVGLIVLGLVLAAATGAVSAACVLRMREGQTGTKRRRYDDHHSRERR